MSRKSRRKAAARKARLIAQALPPPAPKQKRKFVLGVLSITATVITIFGGITYWQTIRDLFTSDHKKFADKNFEEGDLKPPPYDSEKFEVTKPAKEHKPAWYTDPPPQMPHVQGIYIGSITGDVNFTYGENSITLSHSELEDGVNIANIMGNTCDSLTILLGLRNNRLYVSAEFQSILNGENIGTIAFNHWSLYKPNLMDWHDSSDRLEVYDKQRNIVFTIRYVGGNEVTLQGYFMQPHGIVVIRNGNNGGVGCYFIEEPNYKIQALEDIRKIKSNF